MPATVRGKPSETGAKKDAAADHKVDPKKPLAGSKDQPRSTDSPKPSTARQRARDRRREKVEASPERTSPSPDAAAGRIKNLTGFWTAPKEEVQAVRKKRLEISEKKAESSESESETDSDDSDERDEIKRAQESAPTDRNDLVEIEKGRAKSIANIFQNRKEEDSKKKTPFKLDLASEEPTVFENEPVVLEGVAKADDTRDEIVVSRPGRIKDLAVNFAAISSKPRSDDSSDSDDHAAAQKKEEGEVIERGKIQNVRQRWQKRQQKSTSGRMGEGTKDSDADVSDSSDDSGATPPTPSKTKTKTEKVIEQKKVKNIRDRWTRRQDGSEEKEADEKTEAAAKKAPGKIPIRPLDAAKEYGVFENEPVVRDDVVRADDEQPDVISSVRTKKLRRMWTNMEKKEVTKDAKNPTETNARVTTKKKKEEKQEPEPEVPKKSSSKSQKAISGRFQETSGTTDQGKGKEQQRGGGGEGRAGKPQIKAFTVASAAASAAAAAASPEDASAAAKPSAPKSPSLARYSSRKKNA